MNDHAVRTVELRRDFGSVRAVDCLTLEIPKGSILLLLGSNGAGKTTLLRILMGLIQPTAGEAFILGSPAWPQPADAIAAVGYVGDRCEPPNWATLALLEDVQAGAAAAFDRAYFRELYRRRELPSNRPYGALSKGQRRWTLVSLALACRPRLILLDEPADGLDPSARRALYDALRDHVNQYETTAVVTTHVIADVERIGDDVAIIDRGRLLLHAPLEDLREQIRQVEMSGGESLPYLGDGIAILGHFQRDATAVFWIQQDGLSDEELGRRLGPRATIHHVDLETLYLAVTEHRAAVETDSENEVKP
jgi:ABC-2 type transport system ATP-binding protein